MKNKIYSVVIILLTTITFGQTYTPGVGINTDNPKRTLDVNGTTISKGSNDKWFFENPGIYTGKSNDSYLTVIDKDDNKMKVFNPSTMSYASINYATFRFNKLPNTGLTEYDTKIDASKYHVMIGGFIIYGIKTGDPKTPEELDPLGISEVTGTSTKINGNVLYTSRAYVGSGNTWRLKFQPNNGVTFDQVRIDLILNVAIYRKNLLLSDTNEKIVVDMKNTKTATALAPAKI
ncbi:hypothetical protein [Empedobacter falsenii]